LGVVRLDLHRAADGVDRLPELALPGERAGEVEPGLAIAVIAEASPAKLHLRLLVLLALDQERPQARAEAVVLRIELHRALQRALVAFLPGLAVPEVERQIPGGLLFAGRARRRLEHRFEPLARLLLVAAREPDRPLGDERLGQVGLLLQRLLVGLVGVLLLSDRLRYPPLYEEDLGIVRVPGHRFLDPLVG